MVRGCSTLLPACMNSLLQLIFFFIRKGHRWLQCINDALRGYFATQVQPIKPSLWHLGCFQGIFSWSMVHMPDGYEILWLCKRLLLMPAILEGFSVRAQVSEGRCQLRRGSLLSDLLCKSCHCLDLTLNVSHCKFPFGNWFWGFLRSFITPMTTSFVK